MVGTDSRSRISDSLNSHMKSYITECGVGVSASSVETPLGIALQSVCVLKPCTTYLPHFWAIRSTIRCQTGIANRGNH
ncbi:unnamed protein product [Nesidiocoris tenuis]|uniref:Uncharacterized protein n=1 Tax=Nesidiocoris tenuis TaxID=355587 RepID=A0A6H5H421_9HEMI|nr:unnamed protein product [Nesidiocoris tenuis]